jgi:anti-anti-sigma factor
VKVSGEIDFTVRDDWEAALESVSSGPSDVYVDLSEVEFVDTSATAALVWAADRLGPGRRMVLVHPPPMLTRLLHVLWPDAVPTIEVQAR